MLDEEPRPDPEENREDQAGELSGDDLQGVDDGQIGPLASLRPLFQSPVARRLAVILDVARIEPLMTGEEAPAVAGRQPLLFDRLTDLQQWLVEGYVEFLEVFCGHAQITCRVAEMGIRAGEVGQ